MHTGALTITAGFTVESGTRVAITYETSTLVPKQLQSLFEKNLDVLLAVRTGSGLAWGRKEEEREGGVHEGHRHSSLGTLPRQNPPLGTDLSFFYVITRLAQVFNPEGWLDITYVDADMRVGRDDKGNIFVTERMN